MSRAARRAGLIGVANRGGLPIIGPSINPQPTTVVIHNVYFWLKPGLTPEQISTFETELRALPAIDYLAHGSIGKPAPTPHRPVTDHSFSWSLSLHFKTLADHDFYQTGCPQHKRFVEACKTFWDRVVIYDSTIE